MFGDDPVVIKDLAQTFVTQVGQHEISISKRLTEGDLPSLAQAVHKFKGTLSVLGLDLDVEEASAIESMCKSERAFENKDLIESKVQHLLKSIFSKMPAVKAELARIEIEARTI